MVSIARLLFGGRPRAHQISSLTGPQQQLSQHLISGLQGGQSSIPGFDYLQSLFGNDPSAFQDFEAPALRQFQQQIVPGMAERFTGMGLGSRNSGAFQQQLASAGSRLSQDLSAQRAGLRQNAVQSLMGMYGMAMQPQFQNVIQPQYGMIPGLLQGMGSGASYGVMNRLMPWGFGAGQDLS